MCKIVKTLIYNSILGQSFTCYTFQIVEIFQFKKKQEYKYSSLSSFSFNFGTKELPGFNTLGHHNSPISSSCQWCNTRPPCGCQDSCRSCVRPRLRTCACGVSARPSPGTLFQTLSCPPLPCSLFHHRSDNLRRRTSCNEQRIALLGNSMPILHFFT